MRITKCDICKKTIQKNSGSIDIGVSDKFYTHIEICSNCGKPVLKLLKSKKLLKGDVSSKK